jgi:hypothetical protein
MQIVKARAAADDRRTRMDGWIKAIADAEAAAAAQPDPKVYTFLVTYRVGSEDVAQGTEAQRRSGVIELIRSIGSSEEHAMTSTWVIRLHIRSAATVLKLLSVSLDVHSDGLHVAQISYDNRKIFGRVDLES